MTALHLPDEAATRALAATLAQTAPAAAVAYLHGDLGSGKSTLARAWLRTLGVTGTVRSPTYTLVERYPLAKGGEALHLDLYRIGASGELEYLGLDDSQAALWLVEWPDRGAGALPQADLHIHLAIAGSGRAARLESGSLEGQAWVRRLANKGDLRPIPEPNP
ncbi:tRNA (adenosine(37)-N6)-threonylcarbamoyltransferase complex ATPase subunit type 1 TsaE [Luteimonas sp. A611]